MGSLRVRLLKVSAHFASAALLILSATPARADWPNTNTTKWVQYPNTNATGYDVMIRQPIILASDFQCTNTGPITDIHLWTSYLNDRAPTNMTFTLSFWSDLPAGTLGTNYSRPGQRLWIESFTNGQYQVRLWITNVTESFWNPDMGTNLLGADHAIWQYNFYPTNPFIQQGSTAFPTVYWLSVHVTGPIGPIGITNIGWKTATNRWNDDSVYAHVGGPSGTNLLTSWLELTNPATGVSMDLAFALTTTNPPTPGTNFIDKWLQIPDTTPSGLDVYGPAIWDDFRCSASGPITQVKIWGSWLDDNVSPQQPTFYIAFYTDIPAGTVNPYSTPDRLICDTFRFDPGQYSIRQYATGVNEQFFHIDPFTGTNGIIGTDHTIWEYVFDFPTNQCIQTNGNIYWINVSAEGYFAPIYKWGWKTCRTNWNDDAVWLTNQIIIGGGQLYWEELRRPPYYTNSLDMAFEILTSTNALRDTNKWLQVPDTSTNGLDVEATLPTFLADDFRCTATGPITQVKVWGSWRYDQISPTNQPPCFNLGIWTDVPATNANYSYPGIQLCNYSYSPGTYTFFRYTNNVNEQFFDPNPPGIIGFDTEIWEYTFNLPTNPPCIQTNGNIYWLSLSAACFDPLYLFGWKTCPTNFNDDAVWGESFSFGQPPTQWFELRRPPFYTNSLDLAFQILTRPFGGIETNKWLQIPDPSTNGMDVRATEPKILADDFRCTATGPITRIHIWGSWRDDQIPPSPPCFAVGIWSDVPALGTNYSRPGQMLCNNYLNPGQYSYFPYTNGVFEQFWDPNLPGTNGFIGTDTVIWEYVFDLPPNSCWQTNGRIYWVSVTADCFDDNQFLFGWKSCPTNFNDDAVFGHTSGFGNPLGDWQELRRPQTTNSIDLSFQIITGTNTPCPPPGLACPPNRTVECGTNWGFDLPTVLTNCCGNNYTTNFITLTNSSSPCFQVITVIWTVTDCLGQSASCVQKITVVDTQGPVISCAGNKIVQCTDTWFFDGPSAYDLCCTNVTITIASTTTNGLCPKLATRTWSAVDCCSNTSFCSQTVTILDTNKPSIVCPTNMVVLTCNTNISVTWTLSATDACSSVTVTSSPPSGAFFNRATTNTVIAVATDACGNTNNCSFQVIVRKPSLDIAIGSTPGTVRITWVDGGILQDATNVTGVFTDLPLATSPYTNSTTAGRKFYRLRCP